MSSRKRIWSKIKPKKPSLFALADIPTFAGDTSIATFKKNLETISGQAAEVASIDEIEKKVSELFPAALQIASGIFSGTVTIDENSDRATLEKIEVAILKGDFGVAENGAVWVPEANMLN